MRSRGARESHRTGLTVDRPRDGGVDVDQQRLDRAESRRACDFGDVGERSPVRGPLSVELVDVAQLRRVEIVENRAGTGRKLGVRDRFRISRDALRKQMGIRVDRSVDAVDRLGRGEDQGNVEAAQERSQCAIDLSCVLAHADLLSFGALETATRCAIDDRRLTGRAGDVRRQIVDVDWRRIEVRRHLDNADRTPRERQHECDVWKCQRAK